MPRPRRLLAAVTAAVTTVALLSGCSTSESAKGGSGAGLDDPAKKEIAMQLVSSAENSTLDWKAQYDYIEDIDDGRGYTAGIIGFCSGTGDMLKVVERYAAARPGNPLERFLPALRAVRGSDAHDGLGRPFTEAWAEAAADPAFRSAQDTELDRSYFAPAVARAEADGLGALGQFIYYDAYVMHGYGDAAGTVGFRTIRRWAVAAAAPPAHGGNEAAYLNAFLDARVAAMRKEPAHSDTSRVETAQRVFVKQGRFGLETPLRWRVYGDSYRIDAP
ncbi:chitosanase [Streptomyces sp. NBC_01217]|uniref:chitosanase n=1 Tax=Streptomyces sp. NBC_01217 TaxID=2903779 RepID=UPI002E1378FE|nr:chitosanase [Streptomyces sp. NBC_01217]